MVGILKPLNPHEEPPIIGIQLGTLILKDIELIFRIRLFIILNTALKPKHENFSYFRTILTFLNSQISGKKILYKTIPLICELQKCFSYRMIFILMCYDI